MRRGAKLCVAWDSDAGSLLVGVDGAAPTNLFPTGVTPGSAVGVGLFPALSGWGGCRVRCNFRHPNEGYLPCAPPQVLSHRLPSAPRCSPLFPSAPIDRGGARHGWVG